MTIHGSQSSSGASGPALLDIQQVLTVPAHDEGSGQGLVLQTDQGDLRGILHKADDSHKAVVWVCGAGGGFRGPGPGTYVKLAETFRNHGVTSLRLDYREPNLLKECVLDLVTGIEYLKSTEHEPVVLVGHSFGGAVVIAAGVASDHVKGVVSLSPQTFGTNMVRQLSPIPLLLVHGKADTRLPYSCAMHIYRKALQPRKLVLYEGAEHRLEECREELETLLGDWIPAALAAPLPS